MKIVYLQENGTIALVSLADESNIYKEAANHVPIGKKFKIIEDSQLPTDIKYRDAWSVDESELTDGIGVMK